LGWAFKRFLFPMLDERRKRIQEGLEASDEAKQRLAQTETQTAAELEKARQEGQGLIGQAQQMSGRIQEEARQSARAEAETLLERARSEIQLERVDRKAHQELIEEVLAEAPQDGDRGDGQS
jgi:F-type H+-transporting ATPase subunit b